jgi:DNA-binding transcriptional LysR family regulator
MTTLAGLELLTYSGIAATVVRGMHSLPPLPPLDGLIATVVAAGRGSFTAAADELGLTHSAVSRRIQAVEVWLGTALFERHGRGVRLTPAGQRFVRTVEQAFGAIGRAAEQWRPHRGVHTLNLSVVPSFARLWLVPRLRTLQGDPPDLFLNVSMEHRLANLQDGEVDVAIRYGTGDWPELEVTPLFGEELVPAAAPSIAAQLGRDASPRAILRYPLVHDSDASQWRTWLLEAGVTYRPRVMDRRFEDYDLVLEAAAAGVAVALIRLPLASEWVRSGKVRRVSRRTVPNPLAHFVVHGRDDARPTVKRLLARLIELARAPDSVPERTVGL